MKHNPRPNHHRHAELVSASTAPQRRTSQSAEWTLKQVQGDGEVGFAGGAKDIFAVAEALGVRL